MQKTKSAAFQYLGILLNIGPSLGIQSPSLSNDYCGVYNHRTETKGTYKVPFTFSEGKPGSLKWKTWINYDKLLTSTGSLPDGYTMSEGEIHGVTLTLQHQQIVAKVT